MSRIEAFVAVLIAGMFVMGGYHLMQELSTVKTNVEKIVLSKSLPVHE